MVAERLSEYTRTRPVFQTDLDAGVFFWLKEIIDAKSKSMLGSRPDEYKELVERARVAFESAYTVKMMQIEAATGSTRSEPRIKRREEPAQPRKGVKRRSG